MHVLKEHILTLRSLHFHAHTCAFGALEAPTTRPHKVTMLHELLGARSILQGFLPVARPTLHRATV